METQSTDNDNTIRYDNASPATVLTLIHEHISHPPSDSSQRCVEMMGLLALLPPSRQQIILAHEDKQTQRAAKDATLPRLLPYMKTFFYAHSDYDKKSVASVLTSLKNVVWPFFDPRNTSTTFVESIAIEHNRQEPDDGQNTFDMPFVSVAIKVNLITIVEEKHWIWPEIQSSVLSTEGVNPFASPCYSAGREMLMGGASVEEVHPNAAVGYAARREALNEMLDEPTKGE